MLTRVLSILICTALSSTAMAQAPDEASPSTGLVFLLPLGAESALKKQKQLLKDTDEALRQGAQEALGDDLQVAKRARSARCATSARCIGKLAKRASADKGAAFLLKRNGKDFKILYLVADAGGVELFAGERAFTEAELGEGLKQLVLELLQPASLSGMLRVPGVDERAWASVDGVPVSAVALDKGIALGVGVHEVRIVRQEREPEVHKVDIKFGEETGVEIAEAPPLPKPVVLTEMPWWPAVIGGTLTATIAAFGAMFLLDYANAYFGSAQAAQTLPSEAGSWYPARAARQSDILKARRALPTDMLLAGASFGVAAVLAVGTGALAAGWLLGEPGEPVAATSEAEPGAAQDEAASTDPVAEGAPSDSEDE